MNKKFAATAPMESSDNPCEFDRLIRWAVHHRVGLLDWCLPVTCEFEDVVQEVYLRLLGTMSRKAVELRPAYVVQASRRTVTDLFKAYCAKKNSIPFLDAEGMIGRVNRNRRLRVGRGVSAEKRREQARSAAAIRWAGHNPLSSEIEREIRRLRGQKETLRKQLEREGLPVPKNLLPRKKMTEEELVASRRVRDKQYKARKKAIASPEEIVAKREYQRIKTAEYRARKRLRAGEPTI